MSSSEGPPEERLVQAWELKTLFAKTYPEVAAALGVHISTAKRWVAQGRELMPQLAYLTAQQAAEQEKVIFDSRSFMNDRVAVMDEVRRWMIEARDQGLDPIECAKVVIMAEESKAKAVGEAYRIELAAASGERPAPSPGMMRAIEGYRRMNGGAEAPPDVVDGEVVGQDPP